MRKNKYNELDSKIRSLKKRQDEINDIQRNNCWAELDEPEPHGWYIRLSLRSDIANRADADTIEEVVSLIERKCWSKNKSLGYRSNGSVCTVTGLRNWQEYTPWCGYYGSSYGIDIETYKHLRPEVQRWFSPPEFLDYWGRGWCDCNVPIWYWDRYFERCYATHYKEIQPDLISEDDYIDNHIDSCYWDKSRKYEWRTYPKRTLCIYTRSRRASNKKVMNNMKQYDYDDSLANFHDYERNSWCWD